MNLVESFYGAIPAVIKQDHKSNDFQLRIYFKLTKYIRLLLSLFLDINQGKYFNTG